MPVISKPNQTALFAIYLQAHGAGIACPLLFGVRESSARRCIHMFLKIIKKKIYLRLCVLLAIERCALLACIFAIAFYRYRLSRNHFVVQFGYPVLYGMAHVTQVGRKKLPGGS